MFNKEDTKIFIQNWEYNVFARSDIKDANIEITEQRDKKLDRLYNSNIKSSNQRTSLFWS